MNQVSAACSAPVARFGRWLRGTLISDSPLPELESAGSPRRPPRGEQTPRWLDRSTLIERHHGSDASAVRRGCRWQKRRRRDKDDDLPGGLAQLNDRAPCALVVLVKSTEIRNHHDDIWPTSDNQTLDRSGQAAGAFAVLPRGSVGQLDASQATELAQWSELAVRFNDG